MTDMPSSSSPSAGRQVASTSAHATVAAAAAKSQCCVRCLPRPCSSGIPAARENSAISARRGWRSYQARKRKIALLNREGAVTMFFFARGVFEERGTLYCVASVVDESQKERPRTHRPTLRGCGAHTHRRSRAAAAPDAVYAALRRESVKPELVARIRKTANSQNKTNVASISHTHRIPCRGVEYHLSYGIPCSYANQHNHDTSPL